MCMTYLTLGVTGSTKVVVQFTSVEFVRCERGFGPTCSLSSAEGHATRRVQVDYVDNSNSLTRRTCAASSTRPAGGRAVQRVMCASRVVQMS